MKQTKKNILAATGVIGAVLGMFLLIPAMLKNQYFTASIAGVLIVAGLILLAIAFGD